MNHHNTKLPPVDVIDRRATALAEIQEMHNDLHTAKSRIADLERELHREEDRVTMIVEERNHYRTENTRLNKHLVELATQMANIGLLTIKAQEVLASIEPAPANYAPHATRMDALVDIVDEA
jgi:chromosome segregation ATPase